ncbi:N-6 DNA methylase [Sandarakinorhabdus sp.]|uniref:N-6 DNA methylase n=1 Tax=Sandarakinorhabdus sp. TaxID=1916663 RepID=UPI003F7145B1
MARRPANKIDFTEIAADIAATCNGQEASMYPRLFQLFVHFLGYRGNQVLVDTAGDAGRPDVTCRAPSGLTLANGRSHEVDWIVVEAKDGRTNLANRSVREALFAEKSKYITPNTAWFVMVNPSLFIARPVMSGVADDANDIEFALHSENEAAFRLKFADLHSDRAGVPERLRRFREGDVSLIATEKLIAPDGATQRTINRVQLARRNFYTTLRDTTRTLQQATLQTLKSVQDDVKAIAALVAAFDASYGPYTFDAHSLTIKGNPRLEQRGYGADVARLNRRLRKAGSIARLAIVGWPQFRARISVKDDGAGENQALEMFATETANLVLARILLIRFFEDHGFFGAHRYVCNGGVAAFQQLRTIFEQGYTRLLKLAYEKAQALYAAAFDETELDWVFDAHEERLSAAIEWAMFQLSRYDFTTVKGDILTGIYDRFLDRDQRKKYGEYFTPPSIARYIVDRLDLHETDRFLDPACGSGTFLIERYQQAAGDDVDRGIGSYPQAVAALERLAGNDLNTFSAVLAQIQLLWHILPFREELLAAEDFPDIPISEKASSIVSHDAGQALPGRWAELDQLDYGGVGGNPPYVRPERGGEVSQATRQYFEQNRDFIGGGKTWPGISAEANLYALFIYRALTDWCRQPNRWGERAGRMGYVVPLALCGTNENAALRRLLAPDGRWTITEIVDLEVIWRHVFDADVLPMLLIVEARPPRLPIAPELLSQATPLPADPVRRLQVRAARLQPWLEARAASATPARQAQWQTMAARNRARWEPDRVTIRLADKSIIDFHEGGKRPTFRIADAPTVTADYADIFTPDGRIMTRLTPARQAILAKLHANDTLASAFQTYWYKSSGADRGATSLSEPLRDKDRWERREMVSRGVVFAGRKEYVLKGSGHTIFKAENILTGEIYGAAQDSGVNIRAARNRYLFEFMDILPERMWAVARISTCPNAASFDPRVIAFTDTATVFAPRLDLIAVPFDILFVSRIYRYFYVLMGRMSYLNLMRGDVYPTNLRLLPWNETLALAAQPLEALRADFNAACADALHTQTQMFSELDRLPLLALRDAVRSAQGKIEWSESFRRGAEKIEISRALSLNQGQLGWHLQVSDQLYDYLDISDEATARGLLTALRARPGVGVDREELLGMAIPPDAGVRAAYEAIVARFNGSDHQAAIEAQVDRIDALVGPALGLDADDLAAIRHDMLTDPFLKQIVPRWPGSSTRLHGYRTGLDSSQRYA